MSVELHEAAHAAAAIWMRRRVEFVERLHGSFLPGEVEGRCSAPIDGAIEANQLVLCLIGYMAEDDPDWPPPYEQARHESRDSLGKVIELLDVGAEQYEGLIGVTRRMLADPDFKRLLAAIERALAAVPRLDAEAIADLCNATSTPLPIGEKGALNGT